MSIFYKIFFFACFFFSVQFCTAQVVSPVPPDTLRTIEIISARSQRQITKDSTVFQTLAGDAKVKQGGTLLMGDSIILNQLTGIAEVFGNVHINDGDTMHTYAQYLRYVGSERIAHLQKNVKLTDGKAILTTEDLIYNIGTGIANYSGGGKVINDKTVLTSQEGTYYSDTKDAVFKNNVHLVDPKYNMTADSLRYNTEFKTAYFISPTHIVSKDGIIDTNSGSYNLETGNAVFDSKSSFKDDKSRTSLSGDKMVYEGETGTIQVENHAKFVDSVNNIMLFSDQMFINKKNNTFLATRKPVMIFYKDGDSTYVAADTLYSGLRKYDTVENNIVTTVDTLKNDTTKIKAPVNKDSLSFDARLALVTNNQVPLKDSLKPLKDSVQGNSVASIKNLDSVSNVRIDSVVSKMKNAAARVDSVAAANFSKEKKDTTTKPAIITTTDTLKETTAVDINHVPKDSIRYFLGFHHVRIYNDSMQAVSDSMYYSTEDSTFKLFGKPVFWNDSTQVKGDTMHLYTENQKAKKIYVFFNSIVINKTKEGFYHQMGGRTINGYFKEGTIDYIRVKGSPAESIFYPQDDDSAYVGMNRSKGDVIDIYFVNKELNKIKFINDVDGTMYPLKQIPPDLKFLNNFSWEDKRRPKNKLELFE
ncbi:MAG: OstA-like protein [Ferruginibacter sp.]